MNFSPTHYFVEEVVKGVDESDLHRTWIKVVATRNARERSTRLENMCWRIWHLARKKKQAIILINLFPCSFRLRSLNEWFLGLVGCSGGSSVFFAFFFPESEIRACLAVCMSGLLTDCLSDEETFRSIFLL
jgi:hypothetical protein